MQFTLRQMFVCTAYFAAAFAIVATMIKCWRSNPDGTQILTGVIFASCPSAIGALVGAGVGHLMGNVKQGAFAGFALVFVAKWVPTAASAAAFADAANQIAGRVIGNLRIMT
jgi:hypothetical protein